MKQLAYSWQAPFDVAAGLASILGLTLSGFGLFYSYRAAKRAQGALDAAKEATRAVRQSNAGEELRELNEKAKELLRSAQKEQFEAALITSSDLLVGLVQASHRWRTFLGDDGSQRMKAAGKKVEKISSALTPGRPTPPTSDDRDKVIEFCHAVVNSLAEETGKMLARLEGGDS